MRDLRMVGFWRRRGDGTAATISLVLRWFWMELFSDPMSMSAGIMPAYVFSSWSIDLIIVGRSKYARCIRVVPFPCVPPCSSCIMCGDPCLWLGLSLWKRRYPESSVRVLAVSDLDSVVRAYIWWTQGLFLSNLKCWSQINLGSGESRREKCVAFGGKIKRNRLMADVGGGGDKGIVTGTITHPKPPGDVVAVQGQSKSPHHQLVVLSEKDLSSQEKQMVQKNSSYVPRPGSTPKADSGQGPAAFTEGIIEEEEDDLVEVELEDEEVASAGQWTILARYYSLRIPIQTALFDDMNRAWRLRSDMSYKSLRDNMFIITFSSEGDYNFVLQGGPWLHKGDALLVAKFDGITRPSEVPLDVLPVWVRIYDLLLALMTKARGELYGSKLGQVREVDVGEDGRNKHDFFRIRVGISVKRPLKTKLAIKINAQGNEMVRRFDLRYERVPFFCFLCGYIGHSDKDCDKRVANSEQPFRFSSELRCSPLKPFERKLSTVQAMQKTGVARNISFREAGSANSSSSRGKQAGKGDVAIPERVDAFDDFESCENEGDGKIDEQLAAHTNKMSVSQTNEKDVSMKGVEEVSIVGVEAARTDAGSMGDGALPSSEMIPAIKNIHQQVSFGEDSMETSSDANRKCLPTQGEKNKTGRVQQALLVYESSKGRNQESQGEPEKFTRALKRVRKIELLGGMDDSEATSQGAAGKLTGPVVRARQEQ